MEACLLISKSPTVKEHGVTNTFLYSCIALRCIETYYEEGTNGHPRCIEISCHDRYMEWQQGSNIP